ncbi:MAG: 4-hydroxy-tetrahydrodipicolinate reductase [Candidatus Omnitrophica bacterium]|nr:4-hydroxy-tetrahydrodipicolinate reductase [Candidatus Omnitrophota bacterium]
MIKLAVSGCAGKMGARIIDLALSDEDFRVVAAIEAKGHQAIGSKIGNIKISDDLSVVNLADCLIEFTSPEATIEHLNACVKYRKSMVIGTTAMNDEQKKIIADSARNIAVVFSPNMSIGVNLLFKLAQEAASRIPDYSVKIIEAHHVHKKDAPSGTAKQLAQVIKDSAGKDVSDIQSIREGEIIGDHEVIFESQWDTIKLSHSAKTRDIFAKGALTAAKFLQGKKSGLFSMQDVLETIKK